MGPLSVCLPYSGSLFRPPAATQISSPFFAKASIHYIPGQAKQICLHFSLSNTITSFCESFAKVFAKDGLPYPKVASCVPKYVVLYSSLPQLDEDPRQQLKSRIVYLHYLLYLYIDPICTRIWCKYVRLYVAKVRES